MNAPRPATARPYGAAPSRRAALLATILVLLCVTGRLHAQDDPYFDYVPASANTSGAQTRSAAGASGGDAATPAAADQSGNANASRADQSDESYPQGAPSSSLYFPPYSEPNEAGFHGLRQNQPLPNEAFGDQQTGVPYSSVLTRDGSDLNDINSLGGSPTHTNVFAPTRVGNVEGESAFQTGNLSLGVPFFRSGTEPQNADIKAGPFYIKFHSVDGIALYDDNFRRRDTRRESETLVLLRLNLSVIAQLAENLEFAISGSISYLPIQNQVGVEAPAFSSLGLLLYGAPLFTTQLVYDTMIEGWPVRFADDFRIRSGSYSDSARDRFDLFEGQYLTRNPDGGYYFRSTRLAKNGSPTTSSPQNFDASIIYLSNSLSALTDRLLPGDVRLTVRVEHESLYYNQDTRGLPPGRDDLYMALVSERENMRFKPYLSYNLTYVEGSSTGLTQQLHTGIFGPIDDQLFLRADVGVYTTGNGHSGELFKLSLDHIAGPYTVEHLVAERGLSEFNDQVITSGYYLIEQTLGPTLNLSFFADYYNAQDISSDHGISFKGELTGARLSWQLGPKTNFNIAAIGERQDYQRGARTYTFTARAILNRVITDTLTCQLLYQYQRASSSRSDFSYYENLMYFRFIKYFD